ncbi:hypothetical protein ACHWQZ_G018256 [Mnemiopsis leidyi]
MRAGQGSTILQSVFLVNFLLNLGVDGACRSTPLSELEQLVLDKHNELRELHQNTPPLCYADLTGDDVSFAAQNWADHVAEIGESSHTPNPKAFGENIAWSSFRETPEPAPLYLDAVQRWYNEINNWDFALGQRNGNGITSHFTQVVWKTTTQLNCGFAASETFKRTYVVCQYWPKGNWVKAADYPNEVHPLKGSVDEGNLEVNPTESNGNQENNSVNDSASVDNSATVDDAVTVDDSATVDDSVTVDDAATVDDAVTVDDSATDDEASTVDDAAVVDDAATVDDAAIVDDSATVDDAAAVDDAATDINDNSNPEDALSLTPDTEMETSINEIPPLEELVFSTQEYATCNCWTRQCGYCSKAGCTIWRIRKLELPFDLW